VGLPAFPLCVLWITYFLLVCLYHLNLCVQQLNDFFALHLTFCEKALEKKKVRQEQRARNDSVQGLIQCLILCLSTPESGPTWINYLTLAPRLRWELTTGDPTRQKKYWMLGIGGTEPGGCEVGSACRG
jgi:hypothetical protein